MSRIVFRPKNDPPPHVKFQQFSSRGHFFHFQNFWDVPMRNGAAATPLEFWSEHVLRTKAKSHKVWASYMRRFLNGYEFDHPGLIGLKGNFTLKIVTKVNGFCHSFVIIESCNHLMRVISTYVGNVKKSMKTTIYVSSGRNHANVLFTRHNQM